ncbi:hypothetical protein FQZ97_861200 [compost metagenome]
MPLSKLPSPNCAAETLVLVAQAPIVTPLSKRRLMSSVTPRSPARYWPALILACTPFQPVSQ